jgi:N-methylhydantoinase A/oxoprolinase/acetone carboxylase beta subunit
MEGEGFEKAKVSLVLELLLSSGDSTDGRLVRWPALFLRDKADIEELLSLYRARLTAGESNHMKTVREFRLAASCHLADPEFTEHAVAGEDPVKAEKGQRTAYFNGRFEQIPLYEEGRLACGNVIKGPAFIESPHTTVIVPPGSRYTVDKYLNGSMELE